MRGNQATQFGTAYADKMAERVDFGKAVCVHGQSDAGNQFQNARCTEDTNKNKYVNKKRSSGKVDMVVGLINAMYLLQQDVLYGQDDFVVQTT